MLFSGPCSRENEDPDRGLLVRGPLPSGHFPAMFVCPACGARLTAVLPDDTPTTVRCECSKEFVVKLPPARKTKRRYQAPRQSNLNDASSSEETDSHASVKSFQSSATSHASHAQSVVSHASCASVMVSNCSSASSAVNVNLSDMRDSKSGAEIVNAISTSSVPSPGRSSLNTTHEGGDEGEPVAEGRAESGGGSLLPFEFPAWRTLLGGV